MACCRVQALNTTVCAQVLVKVSITTITPTTVCLGQTTGREHSPAHQQRVVIVRQRGTQHNPGENMGIGSDHTLYALKDGIVTFTRKRNNKSYVSIEPVAQ